MRIATKDEFFVNKEEFYNAILEGAVFIYPTDTVYGIGCNALKLGAVKRIREIKERRDLPFSVIVPSKDWIVGNCFITPEAEDWIKKLPGSYTLILKKRLSDCVADNVTVEKESIGVRIPDHWISEVVKELNIPLVTTSVNKTGNEIMTNLDNLDPKIKTKVDFIIEEGEKKGKPSNIVFLDKEEIVIKER